MQHLGMNFRGLGNKLLYEGAGGQVLTAELWKVVIYGTIQGGLLHRALPDNGHFARRVLVLELQLCLVLFPLEGARLWFPRRDGS